MSSGPFCEYLDWDSEFFGRRIARVTAPRLTEKLIADIDAWCSAHRIECLYFLADSTDRLTTRLAQENGFLLMDVRVTLSVGTTKACGTGDGMAVGAIRRATEADIGALKAIARESHRDTRFYYDGNFSVQRCDEFYET